MAGGVDCVRKGRQLHSYNRVLEVAVLIFIATCASVPTFGASVPTLGAPTGLEFLSLDCGGSPTNYSDSHGLLWVPDDSYINAGSSVQQPYTGAQQSLGSFRSFPGDQSKYCYELYTPYWTYLVRASFYMDRSELASRQPFEFMSSIDATDWFTVVSGDVTSKTNLLVVQEAIFYPPNYKTNFCLRPISGVPFISSLELRSLDTSNTGMTEIYSYRGRLSQLLALGTRYNTGAKTVPDVRYPDDPFDRIWMTNVASSVNLTGITSIASANPIANTTVTQYYVPPKVMQDAWLFDPNVDVLRLNVDADGPNVFLTHPSEYAFVVVYSANLNASTPGPYVTNLYLDNNFQDINFISSSTPNLTAISFVTLSTTSLGIKLSIDESVRASLNAVEIYSQLSYNSSITVVDDASVISALKTMFSLTDWQGDPCVPVPFNWLSCDLHKATFGQSQECSNCSPPRSIFATFFNVTAINISNIANTTFSGIIGGASALPSGRLRALDTLSITSSGVDDPTFLFLINYTSPGLVTLNLSYNAIQHLPSLSDWAGRDNVTFGNLTTLDLSHNDLTGPLSSFKDVPFSTALQNLNLSHNSLTSFPENWGHPTIQSLVSLNLSHNQLDGNMSSLDELVLINAGSLQELDVSYNNLSGTFFSDLYFSLSNLTYANFDQNSIQGVLNLQAWYAALQEAAIIHVSTSDNSSMPTITQKLFSFMNNSIVDIVPSAKDFDLKTHSLFKSGRGFGVLLHGNPYCSNIKSAVQRYLCRSTISDPFQDDSKSNDTEILVISVCGGVFALLFICITSATLWKLRKQLHTLRSIQQALAERKVQPPFYNYNDLKIATKDFHKSNKLGHGGFGVVYKGVLAHETLAVKKLFDLKGVQVIDEFLNEVVLITGIKHRNLVRLKGCCIKDKQRILVYEYAENGNLAEVLWGSHVHWGLNWKQLLNICVGVARGLSYLHEELQPSIIHRDIKPQNILLDNNFNAKIADFGLARHVSDEANQAHYTQIAGTLGYFAPEYAMQGQVSDKTDVYSYGILILEVVSGRKCIDSTRPVEEKYLKDWVATMRKKSLLFEILQPQLRDQCDVAEVIRVINIALLCVQLQPERRPTMSQVVTMFLGNMDIEVSSDEFDNIHSNFRDFVAIIAHDAEHPSMDIIEEESHVFPLLNGDSQSSYDISSSRSWSRPSIELNAVSGR